jgi:hypothetical protein
LIYIKAFIIIELTAYCIICNHNKVYLMTVITHKSILMLSLLILTLPQTTKCMQVSRIWTTNKNIDLIHSKTLQEPLVNYLTKDNIETRLVCRAWAQYRPGLSELYEKYGSKNISLICGFLISINENNIDNIKKFLSNTKIPIRLNESQAEIHVNTFPLSLAHKNKNQKIIDILSQYINHAEELQGIKVSSFGSFDPYNLHIKMPEAFQVFDYSLCLAACQRDSKKIEQEYPLLIQENNVDRLRITTNFLIWTTIQNCDIELLKILSKYEQCKNQLSGPAGQLFLMTIILNYYVDFNDRAINFCQGRLEGKRIALFTLTDTRLEKVKKFLNSRVFNLKINPKFSIWGIRGEKNNLIYEYLKDLANKNSAFKTLFNYYPEAYKSLYPDRPLIIKQNSDSDTD